MQLTPELIDELVRSRRDELLRDCERPEAETSPEPETIVLPADDDEQAAEGETASRARQGHA